jgi:hypothetical protein
MASRPTRKQQDLVAQIRGLVTLFGLDVQDLTQADPKWRTTFLEIARDKLIRGQVVVWYTWVDECLNVELCHYFFGRRRDFIQLWKTRRFQNFNYLILEALSLLEKLAFVRAIRKIPKRIVGDIERLNAVRNGLAHALFPQNLRRNRPVYKGKDVFSLEGALQLHADVDAIRSFF